MSRRWPLLVVSTLAILVVGASPAFANPIGDAVKGALFGQSNPMLSFIQLEDAHGINVWQYELSLDRGNPVLSTDKWFWAKPVDAAWQFYRDGVLVAIWVLHWILDFGWVTAVGDAAIPLGEALHSTVGQLGLPGLFLTIAGVVGAFYIFRGKVATGVWEIAVAVIIMAGLSTFLANPVRMLLDPSDGLVYQARDTSMDFVAAMAQTPELSGSDQTNAITSDLISTFIRQPLQMVNFGMVLDGTSCEGTYDEAVKGGPYGWEADIRDKINGCASELGDWAGSPSPSMFATVLFLYPAVLIILVLSVAIGGAVLMAGIRACYQAAKASVTTVVGVLPGAARRPFLGTIADFVIAVGVFVFSYVFLAMFLKVIQLVLGGSGSMSAPQRIFLTDVLLVAGLVLFLVNKKRIMQSSSRLKELLASRPGGNSSHAQPTPKLNTAAAISAASDVARLVRSFAKKAPSGPRPRPAAATGAGGGSGGPLPVWTQVPGPGGSPGGAGPSRGLPPGGGGGVPTLTGRVLTGAAQMGLAHVTGGASTVVIGAYRVLKPRPALPPGPSGRNPSVRTGPSGPIPTGPGRPRLALPPGPSSTGSGPSSTVKRPKPAVPSGPPAPGVFVKRPKPTAPTPSSAPVSGTTVKRPAPAVVPPADTGQGPAVGPVVRRRTPPPATPTPPPNAVVVRRPPLGWRGGRR